MLKFVHTADWQLGASNQPDVYRDLALPKLIAEARSSGTSTILVVGDIFDKPNPSPQTKDYLLSQIVGAPDILFVFTVGNHDYTTKAKDYHSLNTFSIIEHNLKNVRVCLAGTHELDELVMFVLPDDWGTPPKRDCPVSNKPVIAAWHGMLPNLNVNKVNPEHHEKDVDKFLKKTNADYLALGDIHKHVQLHERCWYPGALTPKTYICQDGFVLVEIDGDKVNAPTIRGSRLLSPKTKPYVPTVGNMITQDQAGALTNVATYQGSTTIKTTSCRLDLPKRLNLSVHFEEGKDDEESVIDVVESEIEHGNLVRLKFELPMSVWSVLNKNKIIERLSENFIEVKLHNTPIPEKRTRKDAAKMAKVKSFKEEVDIVIDGDLSDEFPLPTLDKELLRKTCGRYMGE